MQYAFISGGDTSILCRILSEEVKYKRDVLRVEFPSQTGTVKIGLFFLDTIEIITLISEADAMKDWNTILASGSKAKKPPLLEEDAYCHEDTCIEPANESGFCAAHQPTET